MFKIVKERRVWWPVIVKAPADGGKTDKHQFRMHFIVRNLDDQRSLAKDAEAKAREATPDRDNQKLSEIYAEQLMAIADDWQGVEAEDGTKLDFSQDNLALAMSVPGAFDAVLEAYGECVRGEKGSRAGN